MVVAVISFGLVHFAPGDPAAALLGPDASEEELARVRASLGLDKPLWQQFVYWVSGALRGDLGRSYFSGEPVTAMILGRLEPTLLLAGMSLFIALLIGIPAGVLSAVYRNSWLDQGILVLSLLGISMPNFWLGINLILLFAVTWQIFPVAGYVQLAEGWTETLRHLATPALALGIGQAAIVTRITRTSTLEMLRQDFVRTAHAKGVGYWRVIGWHVLRNALIPILTVVGVVVAVLLGGSIVIETVFNLPGIGRLVITAVQRRDYPVIQGVVLFVTTAYVLLNLLIDLIYAVLDPRIKYG